MPDAGAIKGRQSHAGLTERLSLRRLWYSQSVKTQLLIAVGAINLLAAFIVGVVAIPNARLATHREMEASLEIAEQMIQVVRMQVEPIFHRPFGEVKLADMIMSTESMREMVGAGDEDNERPNAYRRWKAERQFRRDQRDSGVRETSFDRSMFLLGKQLVYFERYGKLFLPDTPLLWDRSAFERLLAEPVVTAEVPFE